VLDVITFETLTLRHLGRTVLDCLDFHVAPREIVALVGPEGAGKTAALDCILGLRRPDGGRVVVAGFDVARAPRETAAHLSCVPACIDLPATHRALAHTREHCERLGRRIPDDVLRAALVRSGIPFEWHERRIADFSPALRRKLALQLAVLRHPEALLLDDPTGDLDAADTDGLVRSLRGLRKRGMAILIATRDFAFAQRLATRVVVLERGAVVETFDPNASRRAFHAESYLAELV
jgi:ABC-2 type transport system ATP-binding protein